MSKMSLSISLGTAKKKLATFRCTQAIVHYRINEVPLATLTLVTAHAMRNKLSPAEENELTLLVPGSAVMVAVDKDTLFSGVISEQQMLFSHGERTVVVKAYHGMQSLKALYRSQIFSKQSDAEIIKKQFKAHDVTLDKVEGLSWKHPQMVQFNCTDWRFIRSRLHASAVWLVTTPKTVSVLKPALKTPVRKFSPGDPELRAMMFRRSNTALAKKLQASSWEIKKQSMHKASIAESPKLAGGALDAGEIKTLSAQTWVQGGSRDLLPEEQAALANSHQLLCHLLGVQADIEVTGEAGYQVGQTLQLNGFGKGLDGKGVLTGVQHILEPGDWCTHLEIGAEPAHTIDSELVPGAYGLHIGVVGENKKGPDDNHCLNITLPVLQLDKTPILARLAGPFASKESGLNVYPEQGDEVVIGFFEDDPRFPVILGSMHNPQNKAPATALNDGKGLVLKTKDWTQRIILHPQKGLLLEEKKGSKVSTLTLKEGKATLDTSDGVILDSKKAVQINSDDKLDANGKKGVTIKGAKVNINQ